MKQTLLCLCLLFIFTNISTAQTTYAWTGNVDGTTWEDAGNWNTLSGPGATYPGDGTMNDKVVFDFGNFSGGINSPLITGGDITIAQLIYDKLPGTQSARVRLDLNLTVNATGLNEPTILLNSGGKINFQNGSTFSLTSDNTVETVAITKQFDLIVRVGATVNFDGGLVAVLHDHPQADMENLGTTNIAAGYESGIIFADGTFSNEGTLDIGVAMAGGDGIYVEEDKTFSNSGTVNLVQSGTGVNDHALEIRGIFDNTVSGVLNITGAGTVAANNLNRGIFIRNNGVFENTGLVMTDNGGVPASNMIFGVNDAVYNNNACAKTILNDSKLFMVNNSIVTNNGLIKSSFTFAGVQAGGNATAINNAFYSYSGGGNNIWATGNSPNRMDNGIDIDVSANIVVDAGLSCSVNLGITTAYDWHSDFPNTNLVGSSDTNGDITFLDGAFPQSGTHSIYNCYGDDFSFTINNLEGACAPVPVLTIMCPSDLALNCGDVVPSAATNEVEFVAMMGGTISGGSTNPSTYSVTSVDANTGNACAGLQVIRTYTITNDASGLSESCIQTIIVASQTLPVITCPADQVVTCFEDINADPALAIVTASCGTIVSVYVKQPLITGGLPGCDGTVYTYIYKAVDDCGNVVECEQQFLIQNNAPIIMVPADEVVTCFEDIQVSVDDVTVNADCAGDVIINVIPPDIDPGQLNCPGVLTYTYRVKDACNRIVEAERNFTIMDSPISIQAPDDYQITCEAGPINSNGAIVSQACNGNLDYTIDISGPVVNGTPSCPGTSLQYTYTVTDACGRTASDIQTLTIANDSPTINCPETLQLFNCQDGDTDDLIQAWLASVTGTSSCGSELTINNNYNGNPGMCIGNGFTNVTFFATDQCGRSTNCVGTIIIVDTEAPVIYETPQEMLVPCNGVTQDIFNDWLATQGGAEAIDGCWGNNINWSMNPANPQLNCDAGPQAIVVEFIATDGCGNAASVTGIFNTKAQPDMVNVSGQVNRENNDPIENVQIGVAGSNVGIPDMDYTSDSGTFGLPELVYEDNLMLVPEKNDDPLNGLSTYDLILLQKHILAIETLDSPYKKIAADINRSGGISTFDLVLLRRLILFVDTELSDNTSWRFVEADYVFPNADNPFETAFPEIYMLDGLEEEEVDFIGIKIGDLNLDAITNGLTQESVDRSGLDDLTFQVEDQDLKTGEQVSIDFKAENFENINGFQFTLEFDKNALDFVEIQKANLIGFNENNYGLSKVEEGIITVSWNSNEFEKLEKEEIIFSFIFNVKKSNSLSRVVAINSEYTKAEAYASDGLLNVSLVFENNRENLQIDAFELFQNQPNPFSETTAIRFYQPEDGKASLEVYDLAGRTIFTSQRTFAKGNNQIILDRSQIPDSGVFYYQVKTKSGGATKKMILID